MLRDLRWMLFPALLLLTVATPALSKLAAPPQEPAIRHVLDDQVAAWNRGDLPGYMAGYWRSPAITFYSGGTITTGWEPTLERYRLRYQGKGREMGHLDFPSVEVQLVGPDAALVRGMWHLTFAKADKSKPSKGLFTLLMRRLPEGWRIVHDHSSAEAP